MVTWWTLRFAKSAWRVQSRIEPFRTAQKHFFIIMMTAGAMRTGTIFANCRAVMDGSLPLGAFKKLG